MQQVVRTEEEIKQLQENFDQLPFEVKLQFKFLKYKKILDIIEQRMNEEKIASISQKELAVLVGVHQTNISYRIGQLFQYGALEKVAPGKYRLLHNDFSYTPYESALSVYCLFEIKPELFRDYKKQSEILNFTIDQVNQAWAFLMADPDIFIKNKLTR